MSEMSYKPDAEVVVVGAGPVGLLMALKLGLGGVKTIVIEKHSKILEAPRAIAYLPTVNRELEKMGLLDSILKYAHCSRLGPCWRKIDATLLASIGQENSQDKIQEPEGIEQIKAEIDHITLMVGQDILAAIVLEELEKRCKGVVEVRFGGACIGLQAFPREDGLVEVLTTRSKSTDQRSAELLLTAKWVVGADGSNSFVRKACCIPFEGSTWERYRLTASDIEYKFDKEGGYRPINYITDPEEWAVIARAGNQDVWRIAYGERTNLPEDDASIVERSKQRIPRYLPGSKDYKLRRVKPYWAHQRCAATFRKGNVVLVGDAAHCNNPVGGLGLTSGILDVVAVGNTMVRCLRKNEGEGLIDNALATRRSVWLDQVNPTTQANFHRLFSQETEFVREREDYFQKLNEDSQFPAQLAREIDNLFLENFEG